jgi:hypothetical protein
MLLAVSQSTTTIKMHSIRLFWVLILSSLLVTGCSLGVMSYRHADWLLVYKIDDWVNLNAEQKTWLKPRLTQLQTWHRSHELIHVQRLLRASQSLAAGTPKEEEIQAIYVESVLMLNRTLEHVLPDMLLLMNRLEPAQIAHLERSLAKANRKLAKDIALTPEARRGLRAKKAVKQFERWFGSLSPSQTDDLIKRVDALPLLDEMHLNNRQRWQNELLNLLKSKPESKLFATEVRSLMLDPQRRRHSIYDQAWKRQQQEWVSIVAWMVKHATPAQKARLQKKLGGYDDEVSYLRAD